VLPEPYAASTLEGVEVELRLMSDLNTPLLSAPVDEAGRFTLSELVAERYQLRADVGGFTPIRYALTLEVGQVVSLGDIPLEPRVNPETGDLSIGVQGVAQRGAVEEGQHAGVFVEALGTPYATFTNAEGAFYLALPPRAHTLRFSAEGYADAQRFEVQVNADRASPLGEPVVLAPLPTFVRGTVSLDGSLDGEGLAQVVVQLTESQSADLSDPAQVLVTTTPTLDGRFSLEGEAVLALGLMAERWVHVTRQGYAAQARPLMIERGRPNEAGHFDLRSPAVVLPEAYVSLRGAVALREGETPLESAEGVLVTLRGTGAASERVITTTQSATDGRYVMSVLPRDYELTLSKEGFSSATLSLSWSVANERFEVAGVPLDGATPTTLERDLSASLSGCLTSPLSSVERGAWPEVATLYLSGALASRTTTPNAQGCFSFEALPPGSYGLEVRADAHLTLTRLFELRGEGLNTSELTLNLTPTPPSPPATLRGVVRLSGEGVITDHSGVLVVAREVSEEGVIGSVVVASTLTDPSGAFSLGLERSTHQLSFTSASFVPRALRVFWDEASLQFEVREGEEDAQDEQRTPLNSYIVTLTQDSGPEGDVDLDGVPNSLDSCPNLFNPPREYGQPQADLDGDGIGDACDADQDGDGLSDVEELAARLNPRNADTDGDGLDDGLEARLLGTSGALVDSDRDGRPDPLELTSAPLNEPVPFDLARYDINADGVVSLAEALTEGLEPADLDGDGLIDALERADLDADADGAVDQLDGPGALGDLDGDGLLNGLRTTTGVCVDPVYCDPCPTLVDMLDPVRSTPERPLALDSDADGRGDACDDDDDNDGEPDAIDNCRLLSNSDQRDSDLDGLGDACDDDDDNDGLSDEQERSLGSDPTLADTDRDGVLDGLGRSAEGVGLRGDNCPRVANPNQLNTDGDTSGDACDDDDDNDGVLDLNDLCPLQADPTQLNTDGDAFGDACDLDDDNDGALDAQDNCALLPNADQSDVDLDGLGDLCDEDDDNDGVLDGDDNCPATFNPDQRNSSGGPTGDACSLDVDGDGVVDDADNCVEVANADQRDLDLDGLGDLCDDDADGDGLPVEEDVCPLVYDPAQPDADGDGLGDLCDEDDDNDGVLDLSDSCPELPNLGRDADGDQVDEACDVCPLVYDPAQRDLDGDGLGDLCDEDLDGDGVINPLDTCPTRVNEAQLDSDGDGVGDACEALFEPYLSDRDVRDVARLGDVVWVASEGGGLTRWMWDPVGGEEALGAYTRARFTTAEGTPSNRARHIALSAEGDLWLISDRGLSTRFASSGVWSHEEVRRLDLDATPACLGTDGLIPWASAVDLDLDRASGEVYVAFEGAVVRLSPSGALRCWRRGAELPNHAIRSVSVNPHPGPDQGELWAGTDGGAYRYDEALGWQGFTRPLLVSDKVRRVGFSAEGLVWVLSLEGELRSAVALDPTTETRVSASSWPTPYEMAELLETRTGVRAPSGALWRFDEGLPGLVAEDVNAEGESTGLNLDLEPTLHELPLINEPGAPLMAGPGGRLLYQSHQLVISADLSAREALPSRETLGFTAYIGPGADGHRSAVTRSQGMWSTHADGLTFNDTRYTTLDGLPSNLTRDVDLDPLDQAWVATSEGVAHRRQGRFYPYRLRERASGADTARANNTYAVEVDREGRAWVGSEGGVWRFDGVRFNEVYDLNNTPLPSTYDLYTDQAGVLWAATARGLYRRLALNPATLAEGDAPFAFEHISLIPDFEPALTSLTTSTDGRLLMGSARGLFVREVSGEVRQYTAQDGLPATEVLSVMSQPFGEEGLLWVSTAEGLARLIAPLAPSVGGALPSEVDDPSPISSVDEHGIRWVRFEGRYVRSSSSLPASEARWVEPFEVTRAELSASQWASLLGAPLDTPDHTPAIEADGDALISALSSLNPFTDTEGNTWLLSLPQHEEWVLITQGGREQQGLDLYPWVEGHPWAEGLSCERANVSGCGDAPQASCLAPLGQSAQGLCDLSGNVAEWVTSAEGLMSLGGGALSTLQEARVTSRVLMSDPQAETRAPSEARGFRLVRRLAP
jgi:ligand-binding sensor domain-containing protein